MREWKESRCICLVTHNVHSFIPLNKENTFHNPLIRVITGKSINQQYSRIFTRYGYGTPYLSAQCSMRHYFLCSFTLLYNLMHHRLIALLNSSAIWWDDETWDSVRRLSWSFSQINCNWYQYASWAQVDWVECNLDGTSVVTIKRDRTRNFDAQFFKKSDKLYDFWIGRMHCMISSLSWGLQNLILLLTFPQDKGCSQNIHHLVVERCVFGQPALLASA